ncbi:MAG: ZIP family metal transporter [Desulfovibrio sp.]|nr:ZIP family metal transporter [Desulfovibrio sp.]
MELTTSSVQLVMQHPVMQAFVAGMFSWLSVSLGAAFIFTRREFSRKAMDCLLGAAGGMMLGAAFFGLLQPAMEMAGHAGRFGFLPVVFGLMLGAAFLLLLDRALPHLHLVQGTTEGISTHWRRSVLLVTAMALHHIPEGLAIGVGYGAAAAEGALSPSIESLGMSTALVLTLSIMLQNLPEGMVVSTALRAEGHSAKKSFRYGVLSGITAPIGAVPGALAASVATGILPVALAFAAGAMIYVVFEEVIPEANASGNGNAASVSCICGVCLVMALTTLLG